VNEIAAETIIDDKFSGVDVKCCQYIIKEDCPRRRVYSSREGYPCLKRKSEWLIPFFLPILTFWPPLKFQDPSACNLAAALAEDLPQRQASFTHLLVISLSRVSRFLNEWLPPSDLQLRTILDLVIMRIGTALSSLSASLPLELTLITDLSCISLGPAANRLGYYPPEAFIPSVLTLDLVLTWMV
jgi:hypothetical protein